MLNTRQFGEELKSYGFNFYSGVPCSFLKDLINYAINDGNYIMAANEGDAVAICAGSYLGGRKSVFLCQNSGLTNAISPLTSLNYTFQIPLLGFVSLRGEKGISDEPQHELLGQITTSLLELMQIKWEYLSDKLDEAKRQIKKANSYLEKNKSFFFVVKKGIFEKEDLKSENVAKTVVNKIIKKRKEDIIPSRMEVLQVINNIRDRNTCLLAATGITGRELYETEDAKNNLYMVGSMGCVSSLGLGLSLSRPDKNVIAIDGDGALLMRMGSLATNAYYSPENMFHLLLDNNCHFSTGGQFTVSHNVDFIALAVAAGYANVIYLHDLEELEGVILEWQKKKGLTFAYLKIAKTKKDNLGRPHIKP